MTDSTFIMAVGDHGEGLGDHGEATHGNMLYDSTLHVPFICVWPDQQRVNIRSAAQVSVLSVAPTMLETVGLPCKVRHGAGSLRPVLDGETVMCPVLYAETDEPFTSYGWSPLRSVRQDRLKYIHTTRPELYDYLADPGETENLAKTHLAETLDMADRLSEAQSEMRAGATQAAHLSEKERAVLESLGYIAGGAASAEISGDAQLPDIKDKIHLVNQAEDAQALFRDGKAEAAISLLRKTVNEEPSAMYFLAPLGKMYSQLDRHAEAIEVYQQILLNRPSDLDALSKLAIVYFNKGALDQASEILQKALGISPRSPELHVNIAAVLLQQGNTDQAIAHWKQALKEDPDAVEANYNLALTYEQQGYLARALHYWQEVLRISPLNETAYGQVQRLRALMQAENPKP